jgi:hemerythrin
MKFIEFTDNERLNIQEIDNQHERFTEILNEMYNNLGKERKSTQTYLLDELHRIVKLHFETEERLMKEYNFPQFFSHKMEHDRFLNKLSQFIEDNKLGEQEVNLGFLNSMKNWFFNHFKINDKKCGDFLVEKGLN